jgi:TonB family protein
MFAAGVSRAGHRAIFGWIALAIAGCASEAPAVDPSLIQKTAPGSNTERPAFYVQWKSGLPGLTQRPSLDRTTRQPDYPAVSIRNREEGTTTVEGCVTVDGTLVDAHVAKSSGFTALDQATVEWAKGAKYKPAMFSNELFAVCGYRLDWIWQLETPRN